MGLARALLEQGNTVRIVSRRERGQIKNEKIDAIDVHRIYRLILFPAPSDKGKMASLNEDNKGFLTRAYDLYLRTVYAAYAAITIARLVKRYNVQVVIERASSLGAGALAARLTHRPLIVEVITGTYVSLSL